MIIIDKLRVKYKCFMRKHKLMNQFCKSCGKKNKFFDFSVDDEVWKKLPSKYHNHVLCLNCFCKHYPNDDDGEIEVKLYLL